MAKTKKRPDGRVEIVRTVKGVRHHYYGQTRSEAERKYVEDLMRAELGVTFYEAAMAWYAKFVERAAHNSLNCYDPALRRLIDHFGDQRVGEITAKQMQIFVDGLAQEGYAKKTVQTHLIVASDIFKFSRVEFATENNPAAFASVPSDLPQERRELPSDEDDALMMANATGANVGLFLMIAKFAGLRRGDELVEPCLE